MNAEVIHDYSSSDSTAAFSSGLVLVDFWAPWCGPCRMMHPVLEELARRQNDAKIVKINVDEHPDLAASYRVSAIPLLVLLRDGREVQRFVGVQQLAALVSAIRQEKDQ